MKTFYGTVLGLPDVQAADSTSDFVVLGTGRASLCLHRIPEAHARGIVIAEPPVARTETAFKPVFTVPDLEAARHRVLEMGAAAGPIQVWGATRSFDAVDAEGNVFQLVEAE